MTIFLTMWEGGGGGGGKGIYQIVSKRSIVTSVDTFKTQFSFASTFTVLVGH